MEAIICFSTQDVSPANRLAAIYTHHSIISNLCFHVSYCTTYLCFRATETLHNLTILWCRKLLLISQLFLVRLCQIYGHIWWLKYFSFFFFSMVSEIIHVCFQIKFHLLVYNLSCWRSFFGQMMLKIGIIIIKFRSVKSWLL